MLKRRGQPDPEGSLAIRAAWLHYVGGFTQAEVAKRLALPSVKAHRLIARAVADGAVKVSIDGEVVECALLENRLCHRFGLDFCDVAPDLGEDGLPLRALGLAGASFLRREIERGEDSVIGIGHGRTFDTARPPLRVAAARDQPRALEHLEMLRYGRLAHVEGFGQFHHRGLALHQPRQDRPPRRIGKRGEGRIEALGRRHRPFPNS